MYNSYEEAYGPIGAVVSMIIVGVFLFLLVLGLLGLLFDLVSPKANLWKGYCRKRHLRKMEATMHSFSDSPLVDMQIIYGKLRSEENYKRRVALVEFYVTQLRVMKCPEQTITALKSYGNKQMKVYDIQDLRKEYAKIKEIHLYPSKTKWLDKLEVIASYNYKIKMLGANLLKEWKVNGKYNAIAPAQD